MSTTSKNVQVNYSSIEHTYIFNHPANTHAHSLLYDVKHPDRTEIKQTKQYYKNKNHQPQNQPTNQTNLKQKNKNNKSSLCLSADNRNVNARREKNPTPNGGGISKEKKFNATNRSHQFKTVVQQGSRSPN